MVIHKNTGSIDIFGLQSYDRQLVIRCFANWVCSGLQAPISGLFGARTDWEDETRGDGTSDTKG